MSTIWAFDLGKGSIGEVKRKGALSSALLRAKRSDGFDTADRSHPFYF